MLGGWNSAECQFERLRQSKIVVRLTKFGAGDACTSTVEMMVRVVGTASLVVRGCVTVAVDISTVVLGIIQSRADLHGGHQGAAHSNHHGRRAVMPNFHSMNMLHLDSWHRSASIT
jgi:hypothetical protein